MTLGLSTSQTQKWSCCIGEQVVDTVCGKHVNRKRTVVNVAFTKEYSKVLISTGNVSVLRAKFVL
jgi:hypothetical protein